MCASGVVLCSLQGIGGSHSNEWTQSVFWMSHFNPGKLVSGLQNPNQLTHVHKNGFKQYKNTKIHLTQQIYMDGVVLTFL